MSQTQFVFSADSADLVRQSKSVASAAKQIERAHVDAGKAANKSAAEQLRTARQLEQADKRRAEQLRRDRLDAAKKATRVVPGALGDKAANVLSGSRLPTGVIGSIGKAAGALTGVAVAGAAVVAAYKTMTSVLRKNTEMQAAQDRAASASINATANAAQEFVKNTGALSFSDKQRIVGLDIPQLQRELKISGFDDLVRAIGAATSAGGSATLAVDAARQASQLYPFDTASVQIAAPQLALIAKALGETDARLAAGIVLKTNEFSPIKDIGLLAQSLPSIFSAARRVGVSQEDYRDDAKFAADLFANLASESADKTGEETRTLLRTLIPLLNRFFADRADVGSSLQDRFDQLTSNAADRAGFLGTAGVPGGSQRDLVEKLFTAGSALNTNVTNTAGEFTNLSGAVAEYHRQITELTETTKLAVQQNRLALEKETRNREPGAQARGTLRDIFERAREQGFSDDSRSIASLAGNRALFDGLLDSDAFVYGSSEQINQKLQGTIDRMIEALEAGGATPLEMMNIASLRELKDIANQTVGIDRSSRVDAARKFNVDNIKTLDAYEKSLPRPRAIGGRAHLRDLERQDAMNNRFGGNSNYADTYRKRLEQMEAAQGNALRFNIPTDPIQRQIRLEQIEALEAFRSGGMQAVADAMTKAAEANNRAAERIEKAAENMAGSTTPKPSPSGRTTNRKSDRAANR